MLIVLNSETQSGINLEYDETGIQLAPEDHTLTVYDAYEDVRFRNMESGEELIVRQRGDGASQNNGSIDNVVPFPKK